MLESSKSDEEVCKFSKYMFHSRKKLVKEVWIVKKKNTNKKISKLKQKHLTFNDPVSENWCFESGKWVEVLLNTKRYASNARN